MKRILCPTDFSTVADQATAWAAKYAQTTGSELVLFHVQSLFDLPPGDLISGHSARVAEIESTLKARAWEIARGFHISCYAELKISGVPLSRLITSVADDYDLIIMGTSGPSDWYQFFTGSNTYQVIRHARTPVLLLPAGCEFSGIEQVVVAYDYWRDGLPPIKEVAEALAGFQFTIRILQLLEESYSQKQEDELHQIRQTLETMLPPEVPVEWDAIHTTNTAAGLVAYMERNQADLLVLCSVEGNFWRTLFHKSLTREMSALAASPVLVVHAQHRA